MRVTIDRDLIFEGNIVDAAIERALTSGAVSKLLRNQLVLCAARLPIWPRQKQVLEFEAILQTVNRLEKRLKLPTRGPRKIERGPMQGYWRAHFFQPSFMPENLIAANAGNIGFSRIRNALLNRHGSFPLENKLLDDEDVFKIVEAWGGGAMNQKEQKGDLTGEHLYFAEFDNKRFYLFIGEHSVCDKHLSQSLQAALIDLPS